MAARETCPAPAAPGDLASGAERGTMVVFGGTGVMGAAALGSGGGGEEGGAEVVWVCQGARSACCAPAGEAASSALSTAVIDRQRGRWQFAMAFPPTARIARDGRQALEQNQGGAHVPARRPQRRALAGGINRPPPPGGGIRRHAARRRARSASPASRLESHSGRLARSGTARADPWSTDRKSTRLN